MTEATLRVRTKNVLRSTMTKAGEMTALTRSAAASLVDREERRTGSRMAAYEAVAAMIGASPAWIRSFVDGRAKQPGWITGWNILAVYGRICARIERAEELERAKATAIKGRIDAVLAGADRMVASTTRAAEERADPETTDAADLSIAEGRKDDANR